MSYSLFNYLLALYMQPSKTSLMSANAASNKKNSAAGYPPSQKLSGGTGGSTDMGSGTTNDIPKAFKNGRLSNNDAANNDQYFDTTFRLGSRSPRYSAPSRPVTPNGPTGPTTWNSTPSNSIPLSSKSSLSPKDWAWQMSPHLTMSPNLDGTNMSMRDFAEKIGKDYGFDKTFSYSGGTGFGNFYGNDKNAIHVRYNAAEGDKPESWNFKATQDLYLQLKKDPRYAKFFEPKPAPPPAPPKAEAKPENKPDKDGHYSKEKFDDQGRLLSGQYFNNNKLNTENRYEYNNDNSKTRYSTNYDEKGNPTGKSVGQFDQNGKQVSGITAIKPNGLTPGEYSTYQFNQKGETIALNHYDYGKDLDTPGALRFSKFYDNDGKLTHRVDYAGDKAYRSEYKGDNSYGYAVDPKNIDKALPGTTYGKAVDGNSDVQDSLPETTIETEKTPEEPTKAETPSEEEPVVKQEEPEPTT